MLSQNSFPLRHKRRKITFALHMFRGLLNWITLLVLCLAHVSGFVPGPLTFAVNTGGVVLAVGRRPAISLPAMRVLRRSTGAASLVCDAAGANKQSRTGTSFLTGSSWVLKLGEICSTKILCLRRHVQADLTWIPVPMLVISSILARPYTTC